MIGEKTLDHIRSAVNAEVRHGNALHGSFHNHHEAWAVTLEEIEETRELFEEFTALTKEAVELLWEGVKHDWTAEDEVIGAIDDIHMVSMELAQECVQVMAMCRKWVDLINKEKEESV